MLPQLCRRSIAPRRRLPVVPVFGLVVVLGLLAACGGGPEERLEAGLAAGDALLREGRFEESLAAYRETLALDASFLPARLRIAALELLRDDPDAALTELRPVLDAEPENVEALLLRGQVEARRDDLEGALATFRRTAELAPAWATPRVEEAAVLARLGRYPEAAARFADAAALDPPMPAGALALWGEALSELGEVRAAREKLIAALAIEPENGVALARLGGLHLRHGGDLGEAVRLLAAALRQAPDDPRVLDDLGEALLAAGRAEEAHNLLQRAVSLTPAGDPGLPARQEALARARAALPRRPATAAMPNVLVVILDTVRADHLGLYGYERATSPHLDRLGAGAVVFENAVSQAPWTAPSVASLLTSLHPSVHGIDRGVRFVEREDALPFVVQKTLSPSQLTLAEVFRRHGYRTAGFVSNAFVSSAFGFANGFETYDDDRGDYPRDARAGKRRGDETLRRVMGWLAAGPEEPFFLLVHFNDAHWPYDPPPPFGADFVAGYAGPLDPTQTGFLVESADRSGLARLTAADVAYLVGLYDGEIQAVDHHVGTLLDRLAAQGLERPLLAAVLADHGEELFDHGGTSHGYTLFQEQVHVPLLLRFPGRLAPRRVQAPVRLVDVMPTLLELAGVEVPAGLQGTSLLPLLAGDAAAAPALAYSEGTLTGELQAVRTAAGLKLIRGSTGTPAILFDLAQDPGERRDLAALRGADRDALAALLEGFGEANRALRVELVGAAGDAEVVVDEELQERLRALGYIQ